MHIIRLGLRGTSSYLPLRKYCCHDEFTHQSCFLLKILTCNRLSRIGSVLFPDCFAAFTNCFWDAYRFIGHILNRQSRNFFGGFTGSPASGHTTLLTSTRLGPNKKKLNLQKREVLVRSCLKIHSRRIEARLQARWALHLWTRQNL